MQLNPFHKYFLTSKGSPARWRQGAHKRNKWFKNYHQIDGRDGLRDLEFRKPFFRPADFKNKTVLDVGCNTGQMCRFASELGASRVIGVDYDKTAIAYAKQTDHKTFYLCDDLDNYFCYANLPKFDTVLFLSVVGTKELQNPMGILANVASHAKVMYLEGHHSSEYADLLKNIVCYTNFAKIQFLGRTFDNAEYARQNRHRHMFRCADESLSGDEAVNIICDLLKTDEREIIAVVGNAGVGKTTMRNKLLAKLNASGFNFVGDYQRENKVAFVDTKNSVVVVDDITNHNCKQYKKVIYFDYRALEYFVGATTVIYIQYDITTRLTSKIREGHYKLQRSPRGLERHMKSVKNIYSVAAYET